MTVSGLQHIEAIGQFGWAAGRFCFGSHCSTCSHCRKVAIWTKKLNDYCKHTVDCNQVTSINSWDSCIWKHIQFIHYISHKWNALHQLSFFCWSRLIYFLLGWIRVSLVLLLVQCYASVGISCRRVSVHPSHTGIVLKWLHWLSWFFVYWFPSTFALLFSGGN